ncbi:MAG: M15 family metallopeptidase [Xenococcaceae cyanobacterium]
MTENKKNFWTTFPGILTGIAAVITAVTSLIIAFKPSEESSTPRWPSPTVSPKTSPITSEPRTTPTSYQAEERAQRHLAQAYKLADNSKWTEAIAELNQIPENSSSYQEAQRLLATYQAEEKAQSHLAQAYKLIDDSKWREAIAELNQIPENSSYYQEAQNSIKFTAQISPIPQHMLEKMIGVTWHAQCPITLDQLALLEVIHWDSQNRIAQGKLIVARDAAVPLSTVFEELFRLKFPIHSMRPAHEFGGNDQLSMAANNTSAFNCRTVEGTSKWSEHAYGKAIDINPLINPYIKKGVVLPPEGRPYIRRVHGIPGMIRADSPVVQAFARIGWKWGGYWRSLKDYQHFSHNGL